MQIKFSYEQILKNTKRKLNERFQEFKSQETSLRLFSAAFDIAVDKVPEKFQWSCLNVKHNSQESYFSRFLQIAAQR
jgi:hypothetical protein